MKLNLKSFIIGFIIATLFGMSINVFGDDLSKTVEIVYRNIKLYVDGAEYTAKDNAGKTVEPFIYNGTTYLPVRGVANAFGKDVVWDGKTGTIYLGKKDQNQPDNWLDRLQYTNYVESTDDNNFYKINGKITDYLKNDYNSGMLFYISNWAPVIQDDKDKATSFIEYPLNSSYKTLTGKIVLPRNIDIAGLSELSETNNNGQTCDVLFYVDNSLVKTISDVTTTMPFDFNIDVSGANLLTIKLCDTQSNSYIALTDLALYK